MAAGGPGNDNDDDDAPIVGGPDVANAPIVGGPPDVANAPIVGGPPIGVQPPPPPMAVKITPETLRLVEELKARVAVLKPGVDAKDEDAIDEYNKLKAFYTSQWQVANTNGVTNPSFQLTLKEAQIKKLSDELTVQSAPLDARRELINGYDPNNDPDKDDPNKPKKPKKPKIVGSIEIMQNQIAQIAAIPGSQKVVDRMNHILKVEYPQQNAQIALEMKALQEKYKVDSAQLVMEKDAIKAGINEAKVEVAQLKALRDVFPQSKLGQKKTGGAAKARNIDLNEWEAKGFLSGIYFENLKRFGILKGHAETNSIEDNNNLKQIKSRYNTMIKQGGLDELLIMGIATGYISRDFDNNNTRYLNSPYHPLENTVFDDELKGFLNEVMKLFYEGFPDLKETAAVAVIGADAEKIDIGAITTYIQQSVKKGSDPSQLHGTRNTATSTAASSSSSSSSSSTTNRADKIAALDKRGQDAFKEGGATQSNTLKRGKGKVLNDKEAQEAFAEFDKFRKDAKVHADRMVKDIHDSLNELAQELGLDVTKDESELMADTVQKVKELKEKADTPQAAIASEWSKDRLGALQHAYDISKRKGTPLRDVDLVKLVPSSDRNIATQLIRQVKK